jgi:hypothetical protein
MLSVTQAWIVVAGTAVAFVGAGLDPGWADWVAAAGTATIFWTFAAAVSRQTQTESFAPADVQPVGVVRTGTEVTAGRA